MRLTCAALACVLVDFSTLRAQAVRDGRVSLTIGGGVANIPEPLGAQCGRNGGTVGTGYDLAGGVLLRPRRHLIVQADVRTLRHYGGYDCTVVGFSFDTSYAPTGARTPLYSSTLRVGLENSAAQPLLVRATAGIGRVWGSPTLPASVLGVTLATRNTTRRLFFEIERQRVRVKANQVRVITRDSVVLTPIVVPTSLVTFRVGVEIPLIKH
jgi:hypothetical protein